MRSRTQVAFSNRQNDRKLKVRFLSNLSMTDFQVEQGP